MVLLIPPDPCAVSRVVYFVFLLVFRAFPCCCCRLCLYLPHQKKLYGLIENKIVLHRICTLYGTLPGLDYCCRVLHAKERGARKIWTRFSFCEMRSTEEVTTMRSALRASEGDRRIFISRGLRERRHQVREVETAELKAELEDRARPAAAAIVY